jgi:adenine-specific DNA methylase
VKNVDFLRWYLFEARYDGFFDAIVGNPPFIRYQYMTEELQYLSETIFKEIKLPFTKHTNAWVPFVLSSIKLLRPGGRIAMVLPSELLHIPHSQSLRRFISEQCSQVLILDPEEIWFSETLQGTVLLLAQKKMMPSEKSRGVAVVSIQDRHALNAPAESFFHSAKYVNGSTIDGKWMTVLLSQSERSLLTSLKQLDNVKMFSDVASVDVGIVTGANKFFLVTDEVVKDYSLEAWVHPMFGRSEYVHGLVYTNKDHVNNIKQGLPCNFLWFPEFDEVDMPDGVRRYLETGVKQSLHTRYKCRVTKIWYCVPSVYVSPVAMLKRAHNYPRLILNKAKAYTTDTAYRVKPKEVNAKALVLGFVNSLTCLSTELEGRHYGGGVLELVPSEIERLPIPIVNVSDDDLFKADQAYRAVRNESCFLQENDHRILSQLGLSKNDMNVLHGAWVRLKNRRQRRNSSDSNTETTDGE